jgi:hypothetical protein
MKLRTSELIKQRPFLFWGTFAPPTLATVAGIRMVPDFWLYFLGSLVGIYFLSVNVVKAYALGAIVDRWGILLRAEHPVRYWIQVGTWIAMLVSAFFFPIAVILYGRPH